MPREQADATDRHAHTVPPTVIDVDGDTPMSPRDATRTALPPQAGQVHQRAVELPSDGPSSHAPAPPCSPCAGKGKTDMTDEKAPSLKAAPLVASRTEQAEDVDMTGGSNKPGQASLAHGVKTTASAPSLKAATSPLTHSLLEQDAPTEGKKASEAKHSDIEAPPLHSPLNTSYAYEEPTPRSLAGNPIDNT